MDTPNRDNDPPSTRWVWLLWLYAPFCMAQGLVFSSGGVAGHAGSAQHWLSRVDLVLTCMAVGAIPGLAATLSVQLIRQGLRISSVLLTVALIAVLLVTMRSVFAGPVLSGR